MNSSLLIPVVGLLWILNGVLWSLALLLLSEVLAARLPQEISSTSEAYRLPQRLAVLIPAHNEEMEIAATIQTIFPQLKRGDRLIVIADNCSDRTIDVALDAGAMVIERNNLVLRGKGYALDHGLEYLAVDPPDIVVIVDADCEVAAGSFNVLAQRVQETKSPVQSTYLLRQPDSVTIRDQVSLLAFTLKNLVRPLGLSILGGPCGLTGSGMAFPWSLLTQVSLADNKTADDIQLTIDLALKGHAPVYEPRSRITGRLMQDADGASQRSRWEHGHLDMILTQLPRLFWAAFRLRRLDLLILVLDLSIPPLSLLILLWGGLVFLNLGVFGLGMTSGLNVWMSLAGILSIGLSVLVGWWKFGRDILPLQSWVEIPRYLLWKLPIYMRFLTRPQTRWLKTERDAVEPIDPS
jgi:cellulose synthase/poly-beta-1,6-N-acetylglucosamine synthase-like glycosyltransferase